MAVRKGKQYYSSGEEKGKIMLDRFKVAKRRSQYVNVAFLLGSRMGHL